MLPAVGAVGGKVGGERGLVPLDGRADEEAAGLAGLPLIIEEALTAGPLAAEPAGADAVAPVQELDALVFFDLVGVLPVAGVPDGEEDDLLPIAQFLDAEVPLPEPGGAEVAPALRLLDRDLVVEEGPIGRG